MLFNLSDVKFCFVNNLDATSQKHLIFFPLFKFLQQRWTWIMFHFCVSGRVLSFQEHHNRSEARLLHEHHERRCKRAEAGYRVLWSRQYPYQHPAKVFQVLWIGDLLRPSMQYVHKHFNLNIYFKLALKIFHKAIGLRGNHYPFKNMHAWLTKPVIIPWLIFIFPSSRIGPRGLSCRIWSGKGWTLLVD